MKLDDVLDILGVADADLVLDTADALAGRDPKAALLAVQRLSDSGRDFTQFMRDLSGHLRHLFVVQTLGEVPDSFSVTAEHTDRLGAQAERFSQGEILRAIDLLAAAVAAVKDGSEPRIQLEMALLKATQPQADLSLQALMFRIEQLEQRVGAPAAGPAARPERGGRRASLRCPRAEYGKPGGRRGRGRSRARARGGAEPARGARPGAGRGHLAGGGGGGGRGERHARARRWRRPGRWRWRRTG